MNEKKRIFVVDDSEIDRNMVSSVLKKKGFEAVPLDSAAACLEEVENACPDAILLDILMPKTHGKDVLHALRAKYSAIDLPILMITIKNEPSEIIESLSLGANDYITKPVDFEIAVTRLNTHLALAELNRDSVRLKELESVGALIATYNHEINNPLSIAMGALKGLEQQKASEAYRKLDNALWKISDIVKKIRDTTKKSRIEYTPYTKSTKIVKIR